MTGPHKRLHSLLRRKACWLLSLALQMRFNSQDGTGYGYRLLSTMRNAFGGHAVKHTGT